MVNGFAPHLDLLERQRRIVDQVMTKDRSPRVAGCWGRAVLVDRIPRQHDFLVKVTGADRMAAIRSALQPAPPDPFARQRQISEQTVPSA